MPIEGVEDSVYLFRVLHVVRDLEAASGGPSVSVPNLAQSTFEQGIDFRVAYEPLGAELSSAIAPEHGHRYLALQRAGRWWTSRSVLTELRHKLNDWDYDLIHLHGLWNSLNHCVARRAQKRATPYLVAPRGMAEPWALAQKPLKKKLAMWLYQRRDLASASLLHATADAEAEQLRRLGLTNRIAVVPNGTDIPGATHEVSRRNTDKRRLVFVSRIHPKKGLPDLIHAWGRLRPAHWECVIAGPDFSNHVAELRELVSTYGLGDSLRFLPAVNGEEKWQLLKSGDLFVLPSHSENFGMVVAEALACSVPVITTVQTPWHELKEHRCGWWIDDNCQALTATLREALNLPSATLQEMGSRGRQLILDRYTWPSVGKRMASVYASILNVSDPDPRTLWAG